MRCIAGFVRLVAIMASLLVMVMQPVYAQEKFTISEIVVEGNQRVSNETVFAYLPVEVEMNYLKTASRT